MNFSEVERARKAIRTFFRLRQLSLDAQGMEETHLPLSSPDSCVQVQDVLDLSKLMLNTTNRLLRPNLISCGPLAFLKTRKICISLETETTYGTWLSKNGRNYLHSK